MWIKVFNSAWTQYDGNEKKAHQVAWSSIKKKYQKDKLGKWSKMVNSGKINKTFAGKKKLNSNGGKSKMKMSKFQKWSIKTKKELPDSAFAVVLPGKDGKSVRKLPYRSKDGKVDIPHLRNSLVRVAQGKSGLSGKYRAKAKTNLQFVANNYLKSHNDTISGQIMSKFMSKFQEEPIDKIKSIVELLREKATNKKPSDLVDIDVQTISKLIDELEEIAEYEKAKLDASKVKESDKKVDEKVEDKPKEDKKDESSKDKDKKDDEKSGKEEVKGKKEKIEDVKEETEPDKFDETEKKGDVEDKPDESSKKDEKSEEKGKEDTKKPSEETESKFKQLLEVCEGYKTELETAQSMVSKFQKEVNELKQTNVKLTEHVSKFEQDKYEKLLNTTITKVSKFKNLSEKEALDLKKEYLMSKMSDTALEEIGRIADDQIMSKFSKEPKVMTKPSQELSEVNGSNRTADELYSKMSDLEKLKALSMIQAKEKGFVFNK